MFLHSRRTSASRRSSTSTSIGENAFEETLKEGFPQSMGSARVKKECQEVGVLQFLSDDANGFEQVERGEQIFELLQLAVVHHKRLEQAPIFASVSCAVRIWQSHLPTLV